MLFIVQPLRLKAFSVFFVQFMLWCKVSNKFIGKQTINLKLVSWRIRSSKCFGHKVEGHPFHTTYSATINWNPFWSWNSILFSWCICSKVQRADLTCHVIRNSLHLCCVDQSGTSIQILPEPCDTFFIKLRLYNSIPLHSTQLPILRVYLRKV